MYHEYDDNRVDKCVYMKVSVYGLYLILLGSKEGILLGKDTRYLTDIDTLVNTDTL